MKDNIKSEKAYKTIGEVAKDLGLINNKNGNLNTHTIRFWEKQFTQIKPTIKAGGRRYYSYADFEIIKLVKYLLKDKFPIKKLHRQHRSQNYLKTHNLKSFLSKKIG